MAGRTAFEMRSWTRPRHRSASALLASSGKKNQEALELWRQIARLEPRNGEAVYGVLRQLVRLKKWAIAGARRVVLDERGKNLSSEDFAKRLASFRDQGSPAALFIIGGADGLAEDVRKDADLALAFGAATFPHQLVRILLAEQIYRALTILSNHPYHRA